MIISSFAPQSPPAPIASIIKDIFEQRIHRKLKVDKFDFTLLPPPPEAIRRQQSHISHSDYETEDTILKETRPSIPPLLKTKLIKKELLKHRFIPQKKLLHKKYNHYLINFMHKTNLILIKDQIPPNLSVLETVDQGDYIENDDGTLYQRKDFPHNSNVIRPEHLPVQTTKVVYHKQFQKIRPQELIFQIDDNCVLKLRQIYQFVSTLFKRSIQFCKRQRRFRSSDNSQQQSQNHDFQIMSQVIGIHFRTAKLLYDIVNSFYDLQREMVKGEEAKIRASSEIKESLREILSKYHSNQSVHVPHQQQYISLRQLRSLLTLTMLQQNSE